MKVEWKLLYPGKTMFEVEIPKEDEERFKGMLYDEQYDYVWELVCDDFDSQIEAEIIGWDTE